MQMDAAGMSGRSEHPFAEHLGRSLIADDVPVGTEAVCGCRQLPGRANTQPWILCDNTHSPGMARHTDQIPSAR